MEFLPPRISYRLDIAALAGIDVKCNLQCKYCHKDFFPIKDFHAEEKHNFVDSIRLLETIYSDTDRIRVIHLSGRAEPLVVKRSVLLDNLKEIRNSYPGYEMVMTTNGLILERYSKDLKRAGLDRINLSMNSFLNNSSSPKIKGIYSALKENIKVSLNIIISHDVLEQLPAFIEFSENHDISLKFFTLLNHNIQENAMVLTGFIAKLESIIKVEKKTNHNMNRIIYRLNDSTQIAIKLPEFDNKRPEACRKCTVRSSCQEGCWNSIRITPWYIKPCGIRQDNVYFLKNNSALELREKLISGGKLLDEGA